MNSIIFVDDDARVLSGLRRQLFSLRKGWDMRFAGDAAEAIGMLTERPADVVVTDLRMARMDGAELLDWVKRTYPSSIRIVLSAQIDSGAALRTLPVAHWFLPKPCKPGHLKKAIARAASAVSRVRNPALLEAVGDIELPAQPRVYSALVEAIRDQVPVRRIASIISQDPVITGRLLGLVNSGFFGLPCAVHNVERAVGLLGTATLQSLVLASEVFGGRHRPPPGVDLEAEAVHAMQVAALSRSLFPGDLAEAAFTAGLLHDVGAIVDLGPHAERFCHADIGALLLSRWGVPMPIIEAVAHHHRPAVVPHNEFDLVDVVHVADALLEEEAELDMAHLERLGVADKLDEWREWAEFLVVSE